MTAITQAADGTPVAAPPAAVAAAARPQPDPRYLALRNFAISITVFNILGYTVLGFEQPWAWFPLAVLTGYTTELVFEVISARAEQRAPRFLAGGLRGLYEFLLPAHITATACNMLLYANDQWWPIMFAVVVAVAQKHVFKAPVYGRMRHFLNPSNTGITVTLLLFGTWVSIAPPYQFTEYANSVFRVLIPVVIATAGTVINAVLTKRIMLIMGWAGGFAIQALVRHWIWDVALFSALGVMTGVAFILFTNYMISDPGTTPSRGRAQFVFGASLAVIYAILMVANVVYTLFYATTILCALRGLGWWGAHLLRKRRERRVAAVSAVGETAAATT
ncbi:enediyne biosynthesis protein [Spirillospora sp. NPDC049024]